MMRRTRLACARGRGRVTVLCGLAFFVAVQLGVSWLQGHWQPEWRDPEYARRKAVLEHALAAHPGRPLVLFLGTSRTALGLRPDVIDVVRDTSGPKPLVFNFGVPGAGPVRNLVLMNRLLRAGIRPEAVVVEFWPPFLSTEIGDNEFAWIDPTTLGWDDVRLLWRFAAAPRGLAEQWLAARLGASWANRTLLLRKMDPGFLAPQLAVADRSMYPPLDPWGWITNLSHSHAATRATYEEKARARFAYLLAHYRLSPLADHALRELLGRCRRAGIRTALVWMPESPHFWDWYQADTRQTSEAYFRQLGRDFDATLIDARHWLPVELFTDGCHPVRTGAAAYSRQLAREALPVVLGRERSSSVCTAEGTDRRPAGERH